MPDIGSIIVNHGPALAAVMNCDADLGDNEPLWDALYLLYRDDMPIGTAKNRTGDAREFIWHSLWHYPQIRDFVDKQEQSNAPRN